MYPELFQIPFTHLTVKSYGTMMVIGFIVAVYVIRRLARDITPNLDLITNGTLYALIAGISGARIFYIFHYLDQFRGDWLSVFAIWKGGLELLGGVVLSIIVIFAYLIHHKLPIRRYLDILAISLMVALAFGRIGCFLNGCCFGKPTNLPWSVSFPYASPSYFSQAYPNPARNRTEPHLKLPPEFFGYEVSGNWIPANPDKIYAANLKPLSLLTDQQKHEVTKGSLRALGIHPTQIYSSLLAVVAALLLYCLWRFGRKTDFHRLRPGRVFASMLIIYSINRFFLESLRDDNPFEIYRLTISQILSIAIIITALILHIIFVKMKPDKLTSQQ